MKAWRMVLRASLALVVALSINWWTPATALPIYKLDHICTQGCEDYRGLCSDSCSADCELIFAEDQKAISACTTSCKDICNAVYQECRYTCRFLICGFDDPPPCPQDW
jgi:hypothetical protein